jgi:hypothetical protein
VLPLVFMSTHCTNPFSVCSCSNPTRLEIEIAFDKYLRHLSYRASNLYLESNRHVFSAPENLEALATTSQRLLTPQRKSRIVSIKIYELIMSVPPKCLADHTHRFEIIKSPYTLLVWNCYMCTSGPHWMIHECVHCKIKICQGCTYKAT